MGLIGDYLGTFLSSFKVGRVNLDASGATAARTAALPDKSGTLAMISDIGGAVGGSGKAVVDFGAPGADTTSLAVAGQTGILTTSIVSAAIEIKDSADHSADEHLVEEIEIRAGGIIAGTGFTIYARTRNKTLYGKFNVTWSWR